MEFRCYEVKIEESERPAVARSQLRDTTSGLSRQCSATQPQQLDNYQTLQSSICTAQVVLNASVTHLAATQYVLSELCQLENSLHQEKTHAEWVSGFLTLNAQSILPHTGNKGIYILWGENREMKSIQYHLCSTYRGLWGVVFVQLSWLSGRALAAQAMAEVVSWVWLPATASLFTFLYFHLIISIFLYTVIMQLAVVAAKSSQAKMFCSKSLCYAYAPVKPVHWNSENQKLSAPVFGGWGAGIPHLTINFFRI